MYVLQSSSEVPVSSAGDNVLSRLSQLIADERVDNDAIRGFITVITHYYYFSYYYFFIFQSLIKTRWEKIKKSTKRFKMEKLVRVHGTQRENRRAAIRR